MARPLPLVGFLILCCCGREPAPPPAKPPAAAAQAPAAPIALPLEPADATGAGSAGAIALARLGSRTLAFIADPDEEAIVTFDVEARQPLASTTLGARASAVLVTPGGRVVALGADDARVHVLVMTQVEEPLRVERSIDVPAEPASATLTPKGDAILVASRWGHALSVLPLTGTDRPVVIDLARDPAAVVASLDGRRAFVLHAVGSQASVVDLATQSVRRVSLDRQIPEPRSSFKPRPWAKKVSAVDDDMVFGGLDEAQGSDVPQAKPLARAARTDLVTLHADQAFAAVRTGDAILAPLVDVDTGPEAPSGGYGASVAAATAGVVSFDEAGFAPPVGQRVFGRCLLPRGAAFDPLRSRLYVACVGSDQVSVLRVSAHGVRVEQDVRVPGGPAAISVDPSARVAVVWSAFTREVSVLAIEESPTLLGRFALKASPSAPADDVVRGRALFNTNFDARVSSDGRGCASCHPDGRDDGLAWSSPGGRRQTPMLVERLAGTAPYGWDGDAPDFAHHLAHTTARLRGSGLSGGDASDLQAYLATLHVPVERTGDALVARGKAVFDAAETGCAGCHAGEALTDGDTHDVGSRARGDVDHAFDTPSLHLLSHSAPYFHDGRYASLAQLLSGSDGTMGHTSQLPSEDRNALEAYLRQL